MSKPESQLRREIMDHPEAYAEEYEQVSAAARRIFAERADDLLWGIDVDGMAYGREDRPKRLAFGRKARQQRRARKQGPQSDQLAFDEFAELKAHYLVDEAQALLEQTMHERGYINSDMDGFEFRVRPGGRAQLEIIGFDFEYYAQHPAFAAEQQERTDSYNQSGQRAGGRAYKQMGVRRIMTAASYAMMDRMGWSLPPKQQ